MRWMVLASLGLRVVGLTSAVAAQPPDASLRLSAREAELWLRHVIPLPKQAAIPRALRVPVAQVAVRVREGATDVERNAAALLAAVWKGQIRTGPAGGEFEVLVGVCDRDGNLEGARVPGAEKLAGLPNQDQAYAIAPAGERRLALAALSERGVYYAAATLRQLLAARLQGEVLTIPMARVLDWPDLAERGEWGGNASTDIDFLAAHKMNLVEMHSDLQVTPEGRGHAAVDAEALEKGRLNALKVVPIVTHLDQIAGTGIYRHFPELKGKGPSAQHRTFPDEVAPCFSQPRLFDILADWMLALADQVGVSDICAWVSEEPLQCECANCRQVGQYALEARSLVAAWRLAARKNPRVKLRILLSQGSYPTNDKVLAEIPPEVGVTYYHGGLTYDSSRSPMIYPLLERYAAQGNWLGCYPQLTASWRIVAPFSGPQFIRARMSEFVAKKLQCLCGYATPNNRLYDFNLAAAAEWSWNAGGRDEREFAAAWATTRGLKDPDGAAEWAVLIGPVGWDVYGSRVPHSAFFGEAARMVRDRAKPALGQGMFRYFPTEKRFSDDLAACAKAMRLARKLDSPVLVAETQTIAGFVTMLEKLYAIASLVSRPTPPTEEERRRLNADMRTLAEAGLETASGLEAWEAACGPGAGGPRFQDTLQVTEQTVVDVGRALRPFGVRDPGAASSRKEVGTWKDGDFEEQESIRKVWDVTECILGPGTYEARFAYTQGWHGLRIARAALAAAPKGQPDPRTEVAVDQHDGMAAYENRANVYTLRIPAHDESLAYFLVADIIGVRSSTQPEGRRGCSGSVLFRKLRAPGEKLPDLPLLPMAESEAARLHGPSFERGGLRVGVVQGGYGSTSLLAFLQGESGIDAQPLWALAPDHTKLCQVIVLPQAHSPGSFGSDAAALITRFLRGGGGLIATHNAVGYRGLPALAPLVCRKGIVHLREPAWRVEVSEHPVTAGLARSKDLSHSYVDHVTLEPGPQGAVLARGVPGGAPVVVAGPAGKGRCVAIGLAVGLGADEADSPPTPDEARLLANAVRWAAGR